MPRLMRVQLIGKVHTRSIGALIATAANLRRWWSERDKSRRALASLDDDEISNLSDIGRQVRREARRGKNKM
jgi:uncharacterized protein YjiS (DUF1127 family)